MDVITNNTCCHEDEISLEGEAGLEKCLTKCSKHPNHKDFFPVYAFSLRHLPEGFQDVDLYNLVKTLADLTVRVSVTYTSLARPQLHPRSKAKYPSYQFRGRKVLRTGTGRVWGVRKYTDDICPCEECRGSNSPKTAFGRVYVYTATHVVFDNSEGRCTEVMWGYDSGDKEKASVMKGEGTGVLGDIERDRCTLTCVTCDLDLVDKMADLVARYKICYIKTPRKYGSLDRDNRLTVVVSHPHGCAKTITVGKWTQKKKFSDQRGLIDTTYTYDAPTCPGSSGAPVYVLGKVWYTLGHSGTGTHGNYSGGGWGL